MKKNGSVTENVYVECYESVYEIKFIMRVWKYYTM